MSLNRQLVKGIKNFYRKLNQKSLSSIEEQRLWLLRTFLITRKRQEWANSGFVLPTVAMVSIVVVLLTTAIVFRAFQRSENASNVRVNQAVLNAATPAIERARAKLDKLFTSRRLPRATPTDSAIDNEFKNYIDEYTFGDERQLQLKNNNNTHRTAWMYPVDTDNNGKFDTYTVYGIYYGTPQAGSNRARNPLEARTPPMIGGNLGSRCNDIVGTSATLVGGSGWYRIAGKLKKSFFTYTVNLPIETIPTGNNSNKYEKYQGNKGFSALEYQQDRVQLPLVNNAVLYEDDIALTPGPTFRLNGRIFTNSNFITKQGHTNPVELYQVSSKDSCFYEEDNGKIIVGGNVGSGGFRSGSNTTSTNKSTKIHLFQGRGVNPNTNQNLVKNESVTSSSDQIAYNSLAYVERINSLVSSQLSRNKSTDPTEVTDGIAEEKSKLGVTTLTAAEEEAIRTNELEKYFQKRTRRVPYAEVPFGGNALITGNPLQGSGDSLRPINAWVFPYNPNDGKTANGFSRLPLKTNGNKLKPSATEPDEQQIKLAGTQNFIGDRVLVGGNLPELWWNGTEFVGPGQQDTQEISGTKWDAPNNATETRTRRARVETLVDFGAIERNGEWEIAAADVPSTDLDPIGGLRVITGAGIYLPAGYRVNSTNFTNALTEIWSDMMPVPSGASATVGTTNDARSDTVPGTNIQYDQAVILPDAETPYLRMRATAVYHYKGNSYNKTAPKPIACVSSYYDPTNETTAKNQSGFPDISRRDTLRNLTGLPNVNSSNAGNSHNGIVYRPPTRTTSNYQALLKYQANLKYPNGRWVNEPLRKALAKNNAANRTLSERSAVDSALCALQILDGSISRNDSVIPHGAIYETSFLDGRQIKAVHDDQTNSGVETFTNADGDGTVQASVPSSAEYDLPKEKRQPLEIRATVIDIDLLRRKTIGSNTGGSGTKNNQEYLLPNSGIIYSSRDDALLDLSAAKSNTGSATKKEEEQKRESPVDFILDPTRRPNAIVLINGEEIGRTNTFREVEKGLILASNIPVYIKGDFNLHTQEEFTQALRDDWSNFYTRTAAQLNPNFACRRLDPRLPNCTVGDKWRPASVLADAVTLLSSNFRYGYRNEGDYDLNNNLGDEDSITKFRNNGFDINNYVTSADWSDSGNRYRPKDLDTTVSGFQGSSYINNFVTPIQRRGEFREYLMEVCPKLPVSACGINDWVVTRSGEKTWDIAGGIIGKTVDGNSPNIDSGTTAKFPAYDDYKKFPRRVAFERDSSGNLELDSRNFPIPLGIDSNGRVQKYPYGATLPRKANSALWFQTTTRDTNPVSDNDTRRDPVDEWLFLREYDRADLTKNPVLSPIIQIERPYTTKPDSTTITSIGQEGTGKETWLQQAEDTTFNVVIAAGDTPARPTESNGGLHNFVRFAEAWEYRENNNQQQKKARIYGAFIQIKRSKYATAPFQTFLTTTNQKYPTTNGSGRLPFYLPPNRQWGYDVGLLSQSPDLFAQKLVRIPDDLPDQFFREVGKDDRWVSTLLCGQEVLRVNQNGTVQVKPKTISQEHNLGISCN